MKIQNSHSNRLLRRMSAIQRLASDEAGAAYSISVVMIIPLIIAFIAVAIELALVFVSQQNLEMSAATGAHTCRVWLGHRDQLKRQGVSMEEIVKESVVRSMVPFASANAQADGTEDLASSSLVAPIGLTSLAKERYQRKRTAIVNNLTVRLESDKNATPGFWMHVEYSMPLWTPLISRLMQDSKTIDGRPARRLRQSVWIPIERRDIQRGNIGIPYSPHALASWNS